ncbi:ankyrin repeat domain-containing protein [Wolbachia pipientis]|uniref:ankyrin repeat domain-containing protein n=3 Tax=Wolbachia TaxID=953 RepID=UPI0009814DE3|nr:ankyrin repeat domain-containing protein [Wolbachia pipientis]ONI58207.1 ankyrin repeat family protein [Wolbachia pipientis wVitA]
MNQALGEDELAYYIAPIGFGFYKKEYIMDSLKHICKRRTKDGSIINDHYGTELDKPFVFIANTTTVLADESNDVDKVGGAHWISWVLLPKKYKNVAGKVIENDKYRVYLFDSSAQANIPAELKNGLTSKTMTDNLFPLCEKNEVDFFDTRKLTGQQMNGSDCGWWACYYALMTVYAGDVEFLKKLQGRKLSAKPLRSIMDLQESIQNEGKRREKVPKEKVYGFGDRSSSSLLTDQESDLSSDDTDLAEDELTERAICFVTPFVKAFEKKMSEYDEEGAPGSKQKKAGKLLGSLDSLMRSSTKPGLHIPNEGDRHVGQAFFLAAKKLVDFFLERDHRKRAKVVSGGMKSAKSYQREICVKVGLEIFQKFYKVLSRITDADQVFRGKKVVVWQRGMEKLAVDAVHRLMSYTAVNDVEGSLIDFMVQGVILGQSARDTVAKTLHLRPYGYKVQDGRMGVVLSTGELYEEVGIEKVEHNTVKYYELKKLGGVKRYGYRYPFSWELKNWSEIEEKYVLNQKDKEEGEESQCILSDEKKARLACDILQGINGRECAQKKDVEDVVRLINKQVEGTRPFSFAFYKLPDIFIFRTKIMEELDIKLHGRSQEIENSQVVVVTGESGVGKSELARAYGFCKRGTCNWAKIMWMDASSYATLSGSFRQLAKKLGIPLKDNKGLKKKVESIVRNVYNHLQDAKSFFVFDNASEWEEVKKFLPSSFRLFSDREGPFILITSSNREWNVEVARVHLGNFDPREARLFLFEALSGEPAGVILRLLETEVHSPLNLAKVAGDVKAKSIGINGYLKEKVLTASGAIGQIKKEKMSYGILGFMAYLVSNQIDVRKIFYHRKLEKDLEKVRSAINLLEKFFLIVVDRSMARIHEGTQELVRLELRKEEREQKVIREMLTLLVSDGVTEESHTVSIWGYAGKYKELVSEFIHSPCGEDDTPILHLLAKSGDERVIQLILEKIDQSQLKSIIDAVDQLGFAPLHYAAENGHLSVVRCLIEKGASVDLRNEDSMVPLHFAAQSGRFDIVKQLVENKASINLQNLGDMSPLHFAAQYGYLDIVMCLVENGANVNLQDTDGMSSLHYAARDGYLSIVEYLVGKEGVDINLQDVDGMSSLHFAARDGHLDIVECLMARGVGINMPSTCCVTPLCLAVECGHLDIVKCLVEGGANIDKKDENGVTPLERATEKNYPEIAEYLVMKGADVDLKDIDIITPLHVAVECGRLDIIKDVIEEGVDVNFKGEYGVTLLHLAAENGYLDIVKYLVKNGADVNLKDGDSMVPLHFAAQNGYLSIVRYLVEQGADSGLQNYDRMISLHLAADGGHLDVVKYLVKNGANVNSLDGRSMTPLCYAAQRGCLDIVRFLVEGGANIDLKDDHNVSPLVYAAENGHLDVVKYLVKNGADVNLKDGDSMVSLHYAAKNGYLGIAEHLVKNGANVNSLDGRSMTPLRYAVENDCYEVANFLRGREEFAIHNQDIMAQPSSNLTVQSCKRRLGNVGEGSEENRPGIKQFQLDPSHVLMLPKISLAGMQSDTHKRKLIVG